jgi:hypothetical protein
MNSSAKEQACMLNGGLILKIFLSAAAGLLLGAALVVFPGSLYMKLGMREGQPELVDKIFFDDLNEGRRLNEHDRRLANQLFAKSGALCLALNELDCLPFLAFCSWMGPAVLIIKLRRSNRGLDLTT